MKTKTQSHPARGSARPASFPIFQESHSGLTASPKADTVVGSSLTAECGRGRLKRRLQRGEIVIGPFVIVPSCTLVDALGYAGMDFCILDMEHRPLSLETCADLVIAAQGAGVAPIIRVGENSEHPIARALDIGAERVQVPPINTRTDAAQVVRSAKYSPLGGAGFQYSHVRDAISWAPAHSPAPAIPTGRTPRRRLWSTSKDGADFIIWRK